MNYNDQQQAQQNVKSAETDRVMDNKTDTNNMNRNNYSYDNRKDLIGKVFLIGLFSLFFLIIVIAAFK